MPKRAGSGSLRGSRGVRPDEIMAIGDSENDYSMLSMDIKYTVAMGNAMESIKRIARCQTRSNIQDGVAYAIETLVLTREPGRIRPLSDGAEHNFTGDKQRVRRLCPGSFFIVFRRYVRV